MNVFSSMGLLCSFDRRVVVEDFDCSSNGLFFVAACNNGDIHLIETKLGTICSTFSRARDSAKRSTQLGICVRFARRAGVVGGAVRCDVVWSCFCG